MNFKICQSCAVPLSLQNLGKNADLSKNTDYCKFCITEGKFTIPDLTLEMQIDRLSEMAVSKFSISKVEALKIAKSTIPPLERWK